MHEADDDRIALLEGALKQARAERKRNRQVVTQKYRRHYRLAIAVCIIIAVCTSVSNLIFWQPWHKSAPSGLPASIIMKADFNVYFYPRDIPANFVLDPNSVSFTNGVLIFSLRNSNGKSIAFTEQSSQGFDADSLQGDVEFKTPDGQAFITDGQSRTTAALLTDDHTWVLLNAPQPIGADAMRQLLNGLGTLPR